MPSSALHSPVSPGGAGKRGYRIGSRLRVGGRCLAPASGGGAPEPGHPGPDGGAWLPGWPWGRWW